MKRKSGPDWRKQARPLQQPLYKIPLDNIVNRTFTVPSAILEMQPRTRENEAGVDSR